MLWTFAYRVQKVRKGGTTFKTLCTHYAQFIFDTGILLYKNKCTMQIAMAKIVTLWWRLFQLHTLFLSLALSPPFSPLHLLLYRFYGWLKVLKSLHVIRDSFPPCAQYRAFSMTCLNRTIRLIYCLRYWIGKMATYLAQKSLSLMKIKQNDKNQLQKRIQNDKMLILAIIIIVQWI